MSKKDHAPEAPAAPEKPKVTEATFWHRHAAPIIRFAFRTPDEVAKGAKEVARFRAFVPGDSTKGLVPEHLRHLHSDNTPQVYRSSYVTTNPEEIAFLKGKLETGPDLLLIGEREVE